MKIEHKSNFPQLIEKIYKYGDGGLDFDIVDASSTINAIDAINMNIKQKKFILYAIKDKKNPVWTRIEVFFKREEEKYDHYWICKFKFEI